MTNNNYKNYLEAINEIIINNNNALKITINNNTAIKELQKANIAIPEDPFKIIINNNNVIKELQKVNIAIMDTLESMVNAEETAPTSDVETWKRGGSEEHEMVRIEFKINGNVVTRFVYEIDEIDFKKVPAIIMSCLNNGGGTIDIKKIGSIEIEYFDWDGKGAIFVNSDIEDLKQTYDRFMYLAEL